MKAQKLMPKSIFAGALAAAAIAGIFVATGLAAPAAAEAGELKPHRAIYAMKLKSVTRAGALAGVRGVMSYEFIDQCDAWVVKSKMLLRLDYSGRGEIETVRAFTTWESKSGLDYRFRVTQSRAGHAGDEIKGVAILDAGGQGGVAEFTKPKARKVTLPAGTMFPTRHAQLLIDEAIKGARQVGRVVFDGSSVDNPFEISAVFAKVLAPGEGLDAAKHKLPASREWRTRLAYFPLANSSPVPEFELGLQFRDDGIVNTLVQDFGNFTVEATLSSVELLPDAACGADYTNRSYE